MSPSATIRGLTSAAQELVQRMFPLFGPANDVDSLLLGRRNW